MIVHDGPGDPAGYLLLPPVRDRIAHRLFAGPATIAAKDVPIAGSVNDRVVTFEFDTEANSEADHMVFTGTLADDGGLKGSIAVAGVEGTFTATKQ